MDKDGIMEDNVYINESDGLSNKIGKIIRTGSPGREVTPDDDLGDIPKSLIVTGLDSGFFEDVELRSEFESIFQKFGGDCTFQYFKSFKRVRVNYDNAESSINARLHGHLLKIGDSTVNVYFAIGTQVKSDKKSADGYLHPPTPDKQFLISPPASPPVDWQPRPEGQPNINFDLISALSQLEPGEAHELYKPISSSHPAIVVHIAAAPAAPAPPESSTDSATNFKITQTKRPPMNAAE